MLKPTRKLGFSLAELMIAIAVIAIGLSGVAASLYYGHVQAQYGDEIAKGSQYGRMIIERTTDQYLELVTPLDGTTGLPDSTTGINDADSAEPVAMDAPPFDKIDFLGFRAAPGESENDESQQELARYKRKIKLERIGAKDSDEERLARMTVTIYWKDKRDAKNFKSTSVSAIVPYSKEIP